MVGGSRASPSSHAAPVRRREALRFVIDFLRFVVRSSLCAEIDPERHLAATARCGSGPGPGRPRVAPWTNLHPAPKPARGAGRPALDDVSTQIDKGEFVFLIGSSGSGKSTFLRLLLKEDDPTKGTIRINDQTLNTMSKWKVPKLRRSMGCVFQDFRLLRNRTVAENVAFALEVINKPRRTIKRVVPEVLEMVGLEGKANRLPHELSGGEQQRVAIARAFVNRPLVLLADEPTGNLDPETSEGIMLLLERINRTGTTVIMATHDYHIVDSMRRRVIELNGGQITRDQSRGVYGVGR